MRPALKSLPRAQFLLGNNSVDIIATSAPTLWSGGHVETNGRRCGAPGHAAAGPGLTVPASFALYTMLRSCMAEARRPSPAPVMDATSEGRRRGAATSDSGSCVEATRVSEATRGHPSTCANSLRRFGGEPHGHAYFVWCACTYVYCCLWTRGQNSSSSRNKCGNGQFQHCLDCLEKK